MREATDFIRANPLLTLKRAGINALEFRNPHYADQAPMIVLFFVGLFSFFRRRPAHEILRDDTGLWIVGVPLAFMAIHSIFHGELRYILPVWPYLGLIAAHACGGWPGRQGSSAEWNSPERIFDAPP